MKYDTIVSYLFLLSVFVIKFSVKYERSLFFVFGDMAPFVSLLFRSYASKGEKMKRRVFLLLSVLGLLFSCDFENGDISSYTLKPEYYEELTFTNRSSQSIGVSYLSVSRYVGDDDDLFDADLVVEKYYRFTEIDGYKYNLGKYRFTLRPGESIDLRVQTHLQDITAFTVLYNTAYFILPLESIRVDASQELEVGDESFN